MTRTEKTIQKLEADPSIVRSLMVEARNAGDEEQADLCVRALKGEYVALEACAIAIENAEDASAAEA